MSTGLMSVRSSRSICRSVGGSAAVVRVGSSGAGGAVDLIGFFFTRGNEQLVVRNGMRGLATLDQGFELGLHCFQCRDKRPARVIGNKMPWA